MFARQTLATTFGVAVAGFAAVFASAGPAVGAESLEFQVVATVERQTLSLTILPRPGYRLGTDTPVLVRLAGSGVELPRRLYRREDAVDPRAEAPRFEIAFRAPSAGARIDAELTFYVCKASLCRPIVTRYATTL